MAFQINKPCSANWHKMTANEQGRFCDKCSKNVVDFTQKSNEEILAFLAERKNETVCGRLNSRQLDGHYPEVLVRVNQLAYQQKFRKNPFLLLFAATLIFVSCESSNTNISTLENIDLIEYVDTLTSDDRIEEIEVPLTGQVAPPPLPPTPPGLVTISDTSIKHEVIEVQIGHIFHEKKNTDTESYKIGELVNIVEKHPEFVGGMSALLSFINENLNYPAYEKSKGIEGRVIAKCIIDETGIINDIQIVKSVEGSINFDKEVIRLLNSMPKWIPAELNGKKVQSYYTIPIRFKL